MAKTMAPQTAMPSDQRRYEVEDAMRILVRAEQVKRDPKLMADVRTLASDLKKVAGREPPKPMKPMARGKK
jgi:hypothetical protein